MSYFNKKGFENSVKWERVSNSNNADLFTDKDREILSDLKKNTNYLLKKALPNQHLKFGMNWRVINH